VPEGHTVHRIAQDHNRDFAGQRLIVSSPQGRFSSGARSLDGRNLDCVEAIGKHLFYRWGGKTLHVHLGLYGKFRTHRSPPPAPRGQVRLRVVGEPKSFDLNGPTACELFTRQDEARLRDRLGEDPLRSDADVERLWQKVQRSRAALGALLLNQSVIAGVGNVYRAEVLHLLQMNPNRPANSLTRSEFDRLWELIVQLLKIGRRYNRIIVARPEEVGKPRSRMNRDERLLIYKKEFCTVCDTPVASWKLAARTIFACPQCQPG